jgi:6-phosphogluconolactonase (cycloisomerase 2 family)
VANGIPTVPSFTGTDAQPMGMAFDLTGKYLYVTAYTANALDLYTLTSSGQPVRSSMISVQTGTGPTCVTVSGAPSNANPTHAEYLYTSNQLNSSLTGEQVNQADGTLAQIQGSPFSGSALPTCTVTVPAFPLR